MRKEVPSSECRVPSSELRVLISIQQHVPHWQIPSESVAALRARFPHIDFIYAQTDQERAKGLAECDVAYTWILRPHEFEQAPKLRWLLLHDLAHMRRPLLFRGVTRGSPAPKIGLKTALQNLP